MVLLFLLPILLLPQLKGACFKITTKYLKGGRMSFSTWKGFSSLNLDRVGSKEGCTAAEVINFDPIKSIFGSKPVIRCRHPYSFFEIIYLFFWSSKLDSSLSYTSSRVFKNPKTALGSFVKEEPSLTLSINLFNDTENNVGERSPSFTDSSEANDPWSIFLGKVEYIEMQVRKMRSIKDSIAISESGLKIPLKLCQLCMPL